MDEIAVAPMRSLVTSWPAPSRMDLRISSVIWSSSTMKIFKDVCPFCLIN